MAQPNGSIGNFGDTPVGVLRHPTWHEWDLTLSRRFPINLMGRKTSGVRLRYEVYNVFNEVQFTNMNASFTFTTPGANELGEQQRQHRQVHRDGHDARRGHDHAARHGVDRPVRLVAEEGGGLEPPPSRSGPAIRESADG